jgi:palmitoyl-protein thioesterase
MFLSLTLVLDWSQDVRGYLRGCEFLPYLNNELPSHRNATYKERFSAINKLVLVMVS